MVMGSRAHADQQALTLATAPTGRETELDLSADVLYDSNIARSDRALAAARGLSLSDEVFTPAADVTLSRQFGGELFFLHGDASYLFHKRDTILDRSNIDIDGGFTARLGRCRTLVSSQYSSLQSDLADQSETVLRNTVQVASVGASADCGRAIGLAPTGSVTQSWRSNSAAVYAPVDSATLTTTGGMAYRNPAFGSVQLFGNYSETNFPHRFLPDTTTSQTLGYDYYGGGVSYDHNLGGRLEGVASISYTLLDPNSPILAPFRGLTYSLDGVYQLNPRVKLHAASSRATAPSNRIDANYSVDEISQIDATYLVGTRLKLGLVGLVKSQDYRVPANEPVTDLTRQTIRSVFTSITYSLSHRLSFIMTAGDEERHANYPGLNYSSTRVDIMAKTTF
jgi:hypothetical protein